MQMIGSSFTLTPAAHDLAQANAVAPTAQPAAAPKHDFSFHDFLSIINPLQHLPVVGTLYRAVTGDAIKTPEKIAGDTLYGGMWGLVSSVADVAFEKATGTNFGDTVLGWLGFHHDAKPTAVAQNATPAPAAQNGSASAQTQAAPTAAPQIPIAQAQPDVAALSASLSRGGTDSETAQRALYAYRRAFSTASPSVFAAY